METNFIQKILISYQQSFYSRQRYMWSRILLRKMLKSLIIFIFTSNLIRHSDAFLSTSLTKFICLHEMSEKIFRNLNQLISPTWTNCTPKFRFYDKHEFNPFHSRRHQALESTVVFCQRLSSVLVEPQRHRRAPISWDLHRSCLQVDLAGHR